MRITNKKSGYSLEVARQYVDANGEFLVISPEVMEIFKYDSINKKYTDEVDSYKIRVVQAGTVDFSVKFNKKVDVEQFKKIKFKNLEAIELKNNVYFRADDISEV